MSYYLAFTNTQQELLKVMEHLREEDDLLELRSLLKAYLSDKVVRSADQAFDKLGYSNEVFEQWKNEHFRKSV